MTGGPLTSPERALQWKHAHVQLHAISETRPKAAGATFS